MNDSSKDLPVSIQLLYNSISLLDMAIEPIREVSSDSTNYNNVIATRAVFDVLSESTVNDKSTALKDIIIPQINKDYALLNELMKKCEKERSELITKYETSSLELANSTSRAIVGSKEDKRRLQDLRTKKAELQELLKSLKEKEEDNKGKN
ncbi:hypothetical protein CANARDRAFT_21386 [[Candida] arabinofermentans NRRL YB-2248]|uniref:DASH complex subunit SPC19 n=1 Tax=[Candida] arabinofermentans NRRL YB-2248 TaxID=983967 RepID=A0A1E4T6S3_9ASCO|nr:hypothetical protein CANARDRAFT_21386 [[Candida] arabinofermentans NRRL YB-2248]